MNRLLLSLAVPGLIACVPAPIPTPPPVSAEPWQDNYGEERSASIPADVRDFVIRAQGCGHFSGEPPYDEERRKFLAEMIEKTCTGLEVERPALLQKYEGNAEVKAIIEEVWSVFE